MIDLEGNDLEVGTHYIVPAGSSCLCLVVYSHETESSYIFKSIGKSGPLPNKLYSWRRQFPKYINTGNLPVIKANITLLNQIGIRWY